MLTMLIATFVVLVVFRFSIAMALGLSCAAAIVFFSNISPIVMVQRMVVGVDSFVLLAIPLFVLSGRLMNEGGITDKIFLFARALVGHVKGGLAHANIIGSLIFAGMTGSAVADAAGMGAIEIKAMKDQGYNEEFAASMTIASSIIGPIIPPSIPMVLYGALAEVSVGRLFVGGIVPGLLVALSLMVMVAAIGQRKNFPKDPRVSLAVFIRRFWDALIPGLTPVIIVGGIVGGIFTPTEAAAVAAVYALAISMLIYRSIRFRDLPGILVETMVTTAVVTFIISNASIFSYLLILGDISEAVVNGLAAITSSKYVMLLLLNIILLFFGAVMEAGVALILLVPILLPVLKIMDIDLIHFGVVLTVNLMIGVATPPVGVCLFVVSHITGIRVERLMRAVLPYIVPPVIVLLLITYIPSLVTFIPNLVFGK
ncbi:MAG TPA: TRAP transporter large permease [Desulfobacterales bacterium]|nr:TRAP transporter large permease [Desulfobacterales bacterium]